MLPEAFKAASSRARRTQTRLVRDLAQNRLNFHGGAVEPVLRSGHVRPHAYPSHITGHTNVSEFARGQPLTGYWGSGGVALDATRMAKTMPMVQEPLLTRLRRGLGHSLLGLKTPQPPVASVRGEARFDGPTRGTLRYGQVGGPGVHFPGQAQATWGSEAQQASVVRNLGGRPLPARFVQDLEALAARQSGLGDAWHGADFRVKQKALSLAAASPEALQILRKGPVRKPQASQLYVPLHERATTQAAPGQGPVKAAAYSGYWCETCLRRYPKDPPANKCPVCAGDPVPFAALSVKNQRTVRDECCSHCGARLERSDDGDCNSCGKPWSEKDAATDERIDAARKAIYETTGRELPVEPRRPKPPSVLDQLLQAKMESDRGNYSAKHKILRSLLIRRPQEFRIDSDDARGIVGVTHSPTAFQVHLPRPLTAGLIRSQNKTVSGAGP